MSKVQDVMTRNVHAVDPGTKLRDAAKAMRDLDVGALPVCDDDRIVGILTDRDITVRCTANGVSPDEGVVKDAMTTDVIFCRASDDVEDAAEKMRDRQIRRLVVIDDDKRMCGIVSLGDLAVEAAAEAHVETVLEGISEPAGASHH